MRTHKIKIIFLGILLLTINSLPVSVTTAQEGDYHLYLPLVMKPGKLFLPLVMNQQPFLSLGPDGGHVSRLVYDPVNPNIVYAGTWGSGMYRSSDGGATWRVINNGLDNLYINSLAIDPVQPQTIYAGTFHSGVYKSTNGGERWQPTGPGLNAEAVVYTLVIDPLHPNILYAGTRGNTDAPPWGGGVFKSVDGGASWQQQTTIGEDYIYGLAIDPVTPTTVYCATHTQGVWKTTDGGELWKLSSTGLSDYSTRALAVNHLNPATVHVGTWHYGMMFKSSNYGVNWVQTAAGLDAVKVYAVSMSPLDPQVLYIGTMYKGVYRTDNGAVNWTYAGLAPDFIYDVEVDPFAAGVVMAGTMGDGLYKSTTGGGTWFLSQQGLRATLISGVATDTTNAGTIFTAVYGGGIFKSVDGGKNWTAVNTGLGEKYIHSLAIDPGNASTLYAGSNSTGVYRSDDGGASWRAINSGLPVSVSGEGVIAPFNHLPDERSYDAPYFDGVEAEVEAQIQAGSYPPMLTIAVDQQTPSRVALGTQGKGVFRSVNGGASWSSTSLTSQTVYALAMAAQNPAILYAGVEGSQGSLWKSSDYGANWSRVDNGIAGLTVYGLWVDAGDAQRVAAGTSAGVFSSGDGGASWQAMGLPTLSVYALAASPAKPGALFAGTSEGVFYTADSGMNWTAWNDGLVSREVRCLHIPAASPGMLLVGTKASGLFSRQISGVP